MTTPYEKPQATIIGPLPKVGDVVTGNEAVRLFEAGAVLGLGSIHYRYIDGHQERRSISKPEWLTTGFTLGELMKERLTIVSLPSAQEVPSGEERCGHANCGKPLDEHINGGPWCLPSNQSMQVYLAPVDAGVPSAGITTTGPCDICGGRGTCMDAGEAYCMKHCGNPLCNEKAKARDEAMSAALGGAEPSKPKQHQSEVKNLAYEAYGIYTRTSESLVPMTAHQPWSDLHEAYREGWHVAIAHVMRRVRAWDGWTHTVATLRADRDSWQREAEAALKRCQVGDDAYEKIQDRVGALLDENATLKAALAEASEVASANLKEHNAAMLERTRLEEHVLMERDEQHRREVERLKRDAEHVLIMAEHVHAVLTQNIVPLLAPAAGLARIERENKLFREPFRVPIEQHGPLAADQAGKGGDHGNR